MYIICLNKSNLAEAGRLANQCGLEGCLLYSTSSPQTPTSPVALWWKQCSTSSPAVPLGFHKVDEGHDDATQVIVVQDNYLC